MAIQSVQKIDLVQGRMDLIQNRKDNPNHFYVAKAGRVIKLQGELTDSVSLLTLATLLKSENLVDLSGLTSSSWGGIKALVDFMYESNCLFELKKVPYHIFRDLRILASKSDCIEVSSTDFNVLSLMGNPVKKTVNCTLKDLLTVKKDGQAFFSCTPNCYIEDSLNFLIMNDNDRNFESLPIYVNSWAQKNSKEFQFWFEYFNFFESIIRNAIWNLSRLEKKVLRRLHSVRDYLEKMGSAITFLGVEVTDDHHKTIDNLISELSSVSLSLMSTMEKTYIHVSEDKQNLQRCLMSDSDNGGDKLRETISRISKAREYLSNTTNLIEELAVDVSSKIIQLSTIDVLQKTVEDLDVSKVEWKTIEGLRGRMKLTDPLGSSDWEWTKEEILQLVASYEHDISELVVDLQDFDLVRQLFEHMINLCDFMVEAQKSDKDWETREHELKGQISRVLLTEAEKLSYSYYLNKGEEAVMDDETATAGDMLMF